MTQHAPPRTLFLMVFALLAAVLLTACGSTPPAAGAVAGAETPSGSAELRGEGADPSARPAEEPSETASGSAHTTRVIGRSLRGEPIEHRVMGRGSLPVLFIGLIHGDEAEGYAAFEAVWSGLTDPAVLESSTIHGVPTMNPDGQSRKHRWNARGVDLNRNWPSSNFAASRRRGDAPLTEPETRAVHELMERIEPALIIVFHSTGSGPFVDPDGPGIEQAAAFVDAASAHDPAWRLVPDFTNPPGSLGTYAGLDLGIPTLTVEFDVGTPADTAAAVAGVRAAVLNAAGRE